MDIESFVKEKITWLGHASFRIDGSKSIVYIDPWKLKSTKPADVVCITHSHFDHLSEEDVARIRKASYNYHRAAGLQSEFRGFF